MNILQKYGLVMAAASLITVTATTWFASLHGWTTRIHVNRFGEGPLEVLLLALGTFFAGAAYQHLMDA